MPYPSQIDKQVIVETAVEMLEREGLEALSLGKIARALEVKTPSLYRYIDGKAGLMRAVYTQVIEGLFAALDEAQSKDEEREPHERLIQIADAYRVYAEQHPNVYVLAMTNTEDAFRPDEDLLARMVLPIQEIMADLVGEVRSLAALRGLTALIHGYVTLEIAGQLRRGGDLEATFSEVVAAYLDGWA